MRKIIFALMLALGLTVNVMAEEGKDNKGGNKWKGQVVEKPADAKEGVVAGLKSGKEGKVVGLKAEGDVAKQVADILAKHGRAEVEGTEADGVVTVTKITEWTPAAKKEGAGEHKEKKEGGEKKDK